MDDGELASQQPKDIDEALACMRTTLEVLHASGDRRAIFLRVYYLMTQEVHSAIVGTGDFARRPVFMDAEWVSRLSGRFATRYFESLAITDDVPGRWAWKIAHAEAQKPHSPVLLDALLGINAHINYDLAQAIADNLDPGELNDPSALLRRKFDHDQVNNLLNRSMDGIQAALARDYEPVLAIGDQVLGSLDERLSQVGLKRYRQHVWGSALTYAAAMADGAQDRSVDGSDAPRHTELVRAKLDWESKEIAEEIMSWGVAWRLERSLGRVWGLGRRPDWRTITV